MCVTVRLTQAQGNMEESGMKVGRRSLEGQHWKEQNGPGVKEADGCNERGDLMEKHD